MHAYNGVFFTILGLACFLYLVFCVSVKVKLTVPLLCIWCITPGKADPELTYIVSCGTLNPTHSLTLIESSGVCSGSYGVVCFIGGIELNHHIFVNVEF